MSSGAIPEWTLLTTSPSTVSAELVAGRLRSEGVPVDVRADTAILGEARLCRIFVPSGLLKQARWIIEADAVSEEELEFLATGQRPSKE